MDITAQNGLPGIDAPAPVAIAPPARPLSRLTLATAPLARCTVLIDERTFVRECVLASLRSAEPGEEFKAFASIESWEQSAECARTSLLILSMSTIPPARHAESAVSRKLRQVQQLSDPPPVAVMSDHDGIECVTHVMGAGARAFLPVSMGVEMTVKVLDLVRAGGSFIPASALAIAAPAASPLRRTLQAPELTKLLSPRQLAVVRAMRKGLPNKVIAHELAMCESTVKVHVRAIMRKLNARNRTEVALLTQRLETDDVPAELATPAA